jgi:hypothetical protein
LNDLVDFVSSYNAPRRNNDSIFLEFALHVSVFKSGLKAVAHKTGMKDGFILGELEKICEGLVVFGA